MVPLGYCLVQPVAQQMTQQQQFYNTSDTGNSQYAFNGNQQQGGQQQVSRAPFVSIAIAA